MEHRRTLRMAQKHSDGSVKLSAVQSLPVGATASVSSFLRNAASIRYIGSVALRWVWTNFLDDYTAVCTVNSAGEGTFCVESLLRLPGVKSAETRPKALDFAPNFKTGPGAWPGERERVSVQCAWTRPLGNELKSLSVFRGVCWLGLIESFLDFFVRSHVFSDASPSNP